MGSETASRAKPGKAELRNFGLTLAAGFAILGALFLWRHKPIYVYFFIAATVFVVLGLAVPAVLRPVQRLWLKLGDRLGWVMTRVIMVVMFYAVVTPIGLIARATGKDFLHLKFDKDSKTYWVRVKSQDKTREDYERQY